MEWMPQENRHKMDATSANRMGGSNAFCEQWRERNIDTNKLNTSNVKSNILFTPRSESSPQKLCIAKCNSVANYHYWRTEHKYCLTDMKLFKSPSVLFPNTETIAADEKGSLQLSNKLLKEAKTSMALAQLRSSSLISIGQLCDNNYKILFTK